MVDVSISLMSLCGELHCWDLLLLEDTIVMLNLAYCRFHAIFQIVIQHEYVGEYTKWSGYTGFTKPARAIGLNSIKSYTRGEILIFPTLKIAISYFLFLTMLFNIFFMFTYFLNLGGREIKFLTIVVIFSGKT